MKKKSLYPSLLETANVKSEHRIRKVWYSQLSVNMPICTQSPKSVVLQHTPIYTLPERGPRLSGCLAAAISVHSASRELTVCERLAMWPGWHLTCLTWSFPPPTVSSSLSLSSPLVIIGNLLLQDGVSIRLMSMLLWHHAVPCKSELETLQTSVKFICVCVCVLGRGGTATTGKYTVRGVSGSSFQGHGMGRQPSSTACYPPW